MKRFETDKIRNVALIGHGGGGKTSLAEAMIFVAGATNRLGKVDDETSLMNFEPEEKSHKLTFSTSVASFEYAKHKVTLLDTPGYDVFLFDGIMSLQAVEAAVLVTSAEAGGIKFEAEKMWRRCDELSIPRAVYISRMDKENTNFDKAVVNLREHFTANFVPVQFPIGAQAGFKGYVDLVTMKAYTFAGDNGKPVEGAVPGDIASAAQSARDSMVESLVETDDQLMEKFFDGQEISEAELRGALRKGFVGGTFVPVMLGASTKAFGAAAVLDLIVSSAPSPLDRIAPLTAMKDGGAEIELKPDEAAPLAALVFKTISDPFAGRLNLIRVYSGKMTPDASYWNTNHEGDERVGQIASLLGKELSSMTSAGPGDIFAVPKLRDTKSGDTLCDKKAVLKIPHAEPPMTLMTYAAYPKSKGDEEKLGQGLRKIQDEDPTIKLTREDQTHELLVSCMGKLHIDIMTERMKRKYGAEVDLRIPKVPYRETLKGTTKIQGRHKKQSGGRGQFADTWIEIKPRKRGEGFLFVDRIVGGAIPRQYIPAVEAGVRERMAKGVLAGYPMVDVEVGLYDGKYHDVDSSEMAFKIAGSVGFKKGALLCNPVLLEPIHDVLVTVPDEHLGDVIGDLNSRRGRVLGMEPKDGVQSVRAHVPLVEIQEYAPDLRSMTAGRGFFEMHFDHYEEVPAHLAEKIVAGAQMEHEEEE